MSVRHLCRGLFWYGPCAVCWNLSFGDGDVHTSMVGETMSLNLSYIRSPEGLAPNLRGWQIPRKVCSSCKHLGTGGHTMSVSCPSLVVWALLAVLTASKVAGCCCLLTLPAPGHGMTNMSVSCLFSRGLGASRSLNRWILQGDQENGLAEPQVAQLMWDRHQDAVCAAISHNQAICRNKRLLLAYK